MPMIAGKEVTLRQIKGTLALLRHYRKFLRSEYEWCPDPEGRWACGNINKAEGQRRLWFLVNTAINRKAGIPDHVNNIELWRDCQLVQHLIHRNNPSGLQWRWHNMRKFRTSYMQKRYWYLLKPETEVVVYDEVHGACPRCGRNHKGSLVFKTLENGKTLITQPCGGKGIEI